MANADLIGTNRFRSWNMKDQIDAKTIAEFENIYEPLVQAPTILSGWFAPSPTNAAYVVRSQKNLRQV